MELFPDQLDPIEIKCERIAMVWDADPTSKTNSMLICYTKSKHNAICEINNWEFKEVGVIKYTYICYVPCWKYEEIPTTDVWIFQRKTDL